MSRKMHKGLYHADTVAGTFTRRVDDHFYTQAAIGWGAPVGAELPIPTTLRPRHAEGVDAAGMRHTVVIPSTTSDVWTRTAAGWNILDDDGATQAVTTTGLVGESITF